MRKLFGLIVLAGCWWLLIITKRDIAENDRRLEVYESQGFQRRIDSLKSVEPEVVEPSPTPKITPEQFNRKYDSLKKALNYDPEKYRENGQ